MQQHSKPALHMAEISGRQMRSVLVELKPISGNGSDVVCQHLLHLAGIPPVSTNGTRPCRGFCGGVV